MKRTGLSKLSTRSPDEIKTARPKRRANVPLSSSRAIGSTCGLARRRGTFGFRVGPACYKGPVRSVEHGVARRGAHRRRPPAWRAFCDRRGDDARARPPSRPRARRPLGAHDRGLAAGQHGLACRSSGTATSQWSARSSEAIERRKSRCSRHRDWTLKLGGNLPKAERREQVEQQAYKGRRESFGPARDALSAECIGVRGQRPLMHLISAPRNRLILLT